MATGQLVYTLPKASTLFNGFGFFVSALNNSVTFAVNAADGFSGAASGQSMTIPPGSQAFVSTNAQTSGTWFLTLTGLPSLNAPLNLNLSAAVGSNALTVTVLDRNGNTPSTASPVIYPVSLNGNLVPRAITGALSITVPTGATVGTVSSLAGRLWVASCDNSGTPVLGLYNSLNASGPSIKAWDETSPITGTAISTGAISSQTWYTASVVSNVACRVLGYVEFTQPTAGTWSVAPSKVQLYGPAVKRPGDVVQEQTSVIATQDTTTSTTFVALTNNRISITPNSAANLIRVESYGLAALPNPGTGTATGNLQLSRGATANTNLFGVFGQTTLATAGSASGVTIVTIPLAGVDTPNTVGSTTYSVQAKINTGTTFAYGGSTYMAAREIQI
jgi:hypothetical protein